MDQWKDVELVIQTGKAMDINLYTVEIYQRDGSGVLTIDIGKEEVGTGDIKVANWTLKDSSEFAAPLPGFEEGATQKVRPAVDSSGNGYILRYNDTGLYFPKPYSKIVKALVTADYGAAFVTWPECQRCWEVLTSSSPSVCLDPAPEDVQVYIPPFLCDKTAPEMCDQHETVKDKYDVKYACSAQHNIWYKDVDLYKAKCNITEVEMQCLADNSDCSAWFAKDPNAPACCGQCVNWDFGDIRCVPKDSIKHGTEAMAKMREHSERKLLI